MVSVLYSRKTEKQVRKGLKHHKLPSDFLDSCEKNARLFVSEFLKQPLAEACVEYRSPNELPKKYRNATGVALGKSHILMNIDKMFRNSGLGTYFGITPKIELTHYLVHEHVHASVDEMGPFGKLVEFYQTKTGLERLFIKPQTILDKLLGRKPELTESQRNRLIHFNTLLAGGQYMVEARATRVELAYLKSAFRQART